MRRDSIYVSVLWRNLEGKELHSVLHPHPHSHPHPYPSHSPLEMIASSALTCGSLWRCFNEPSSHGSHSPTNRSRKIQETRDTALKLHCGKFRAVDRAPLHRTKNSIQRGWAGEILGSDPFMPGSGHIAGLQGRISSDRISLGNFSDGFITIVPEKPRPERIVS